MQQWLEFGVSLRGFLDTGGMVLWTLLALSLVMWFLIVERYLYIIWGHPRRLAAVQAEWRGRLERTSWFAHKVRQAMIGELSLSLHRYLLQIRALIAVCPLLGLLGTVTGMIHVFDVMAFIGGGNARAMANGVSMATIPTMGGMVIALSGLFFSSDLQRRAALETQRSADSLRGHLT